MILKKTPQSKEHKEIGKKEELRTSQKEIPEWIGLNPPVYKHRSTKQVKHMAVKLGKRAEDLDSSITDTDSTHSEANGEVSVDSLGVAHL
jgi:hypothetical protein